MLLFSWIIVMMPVLWLIHKTKILSPCFNKAYFKVVCLIIGMRVKIIEGKLSTKQNLLLLSNHISYLDIFLLGSQLKINFISKDDVKNWPIFGIITKLGNTVYISRDKTKAKSQINLIEQEVLERKLPLLIFPEGTSGNGSEMLPFKSSMFAMFQNHIGSEAPLQNQITVQPVSIAYTKNGKHKLDESERANYAWYIKEQGLMEHLFNAMKHTPFTAEIIIHNEIDISKFKDRKELSTYCQNIVADGFKKLTS